MIRVLGVLLLLSCGHGLEGKDCAPLAAVVCEGMIPYQCWVLEADPSKPVWVRNNALTGECK